MKASVVVSRLRQLGDAQIAAHSQRFFKTGPGEYGEGDRFLGIRVPVLRTELKRYLDLPLHEILKLLRSPYHEARLSALLMLVERFKRGGDSSQEAIYRHYLEHTPYINNWDLVDSSAPQIVGAYLQERDKDVLYRLVASESLWERRIAVMASFHFIRQCSYADALALCEALLDDSEDLIHKATGWMLREIGKRDGAVERKFLKRHYHNMPRTMLRYAIEKFPQSERQRYLNTPRAG
ncbi:MAG: DNA alkylation repair protein [Chromatiales bacterium]|jgi:3-methyladenine DNA glycosylase AlkD